MSDIPNTWIEPRIVSAGFLPDIGVHKKGDLVVLESSRSVHAGAAILCLLSLAVLIPVKVFDFSVPYYVQIVISIGCIWAAVCAVAGNNLLHKWYGLSLIVNLELGTVSLKGSSHTFVFPLDRVVGLQLLSGSPDCSRYQLNLVFEDDDKKIVREVLSTNCTRYYVSRLAAAFERFVGWRIFDLSSRHLDPIPNSMG